MKGGADRRPRVRILTLGCAKNSVDSEVMAGLLEEAGYEVVSSGRAEVGVVNTCGFIRDAKEESIEEILGMALEKERGRIGRLVVAGCLASRYRGELPAALPEADLFVGPGDLPALPGLVGKLLAGGKAPREAVTETPLPEEAYARRRGEGPGAYLKVLEGCDHRCSYCTIPRIRGPLRSRDRDSLLAEARSLVRRGAREINLIGQDISSYGEDRGERGGLVPLVRKLRGIRGLSWIRLLYLYPGRVGEDLIDLLAEGGKVVPYLDLPIQHIDGDLLRKMGRRYGPEEVHRLLARLRERVPGIFLRTSLIVGFPGEGEASFDRLLRFVAEARFDYLGVFPWSREEGTPAWGMRPRVPEPVRRERARIVQDLQADLLAERNRSRVGSRLEVLVEEAAGGGRATGRHRGQAPEVDGQVFLSGCRAAPGDLVRATVTRSREWDLFANGSGDTG